MEGARRQWDLLIVGQGLAGSAMAMTARLAGLQVAIAEPDSLPGRTASRVAAGLITPLTGKKINPGWRLEELLPIAREYYHQVAALLRVDSFHQQPVHRWFVSEEEARSFELRLGEARINKWVAGLLAPNPRLHAPWGGFVMADSAWLDVPVYLDAVRRLFVYSGAWFDDVVEESAMVVGTDGIHWGGQHFARVVFCNGLAAAKSTRFFPDLPFRPASGEVLEVRMENPPAVVWNSAGKWLAPRPDGTCLFGATYGFGQWTAEPSPAGRVELDSALAGLLVAPARVIGQRAGVRPILHQSRPVAGFLPDNPRIGLLNGLGSKGVLTAPWAAAAMVAAICNGAGLDPELDLARVRHFHRSLSAQ